MGATAGFSAVKAALPEKVNSSFSLNFLAISGI